MSYLVSSDRKGQQLSRYSFRKSGLSAAGLLSAFALTAAACGASAEVTQQTDSQATLTTQSRGQVEDGQVDDDDPSEPSTRTSLAPGPMVTNGVHPTDLAVSCLSDSGSLVRLISDFGGEVVGECNELNMLRTRFQVSSLADLLDVRDALRSDGIDASVIATLDPGDLGEGTEDDPA